MEHLIKDEHYQEALRNILRRCPSSNNRKALLLLLEQSAYLTRGKKWECSLFYSKMGNIDINELMLWIQEEINSLKNAMLESRLAPILDEESPPSDDFLTNQKINNFLLSNTNIPNINNINNINNIPNINQMNNQMNNMKLNNNFGDHNMNGSTGANNNFGGHEKRENIISAHNIEPHVLFSSQGEQRAPNEVSPLFNPNEQRKPSDEELEYLSLQALKFDNLSSDEETGVADLIDLNNYIPQPHPPIQDPILIDPIENVKAHFNKNSGSKDTKTIFNTMLPGANPVNQFNGVNPGVNNLGNFNTQIATDLLSSFMGANNKSAGFEPTIRAAFPGPQFPAPPQAFSAQPQHNPSDPLLRQSSVPAMTRSGSHDANRQLSFDSSRQPFSVHSPQQNLPTSVPSPQQAFPNHSPQQQPFQFGPTPNGHPTPQPQHQNGLSETTPPGFFNAMRPPRSATDEQNSTLNHDPQSHIMFGTPESPQVAQSPVIQPVQSPLLFSKPIQELPPPPPQNIFPIIRPKGTLPPPPGLPPLSEPLRQQSQDSNRQLSYESNNRQSSYESNRQTSFESSHLLSAQSSVEGRHASSDRINCRHDSTCSTDTDQSLHNQEDDYSITNFPNMESKLFKDDNATDIMYQYKVVSQTQLESFVTNGEVKAQIRALNVFYTISPCSDPNFFVISLSGTHRAVTKAMEVLLPELSSKDTNYLCITLNCQNLSDHVFEMIKKLFPGVTITPTEEDDTKYQINGTKGKVDSAVNMIRFFSSSPEKIFGICYRLHPILYQTEERLEELVMMSAKITTHSPDNIFILGSSEAEGFKYLFVHGLADTGNQYKLQRYINAQVEKLEQEAREEGSTPAPTPTLNINRQNTTSDVIRYSREELLKVRELITEPLPALKQCKLAIVRVHLGMHARDRDTSVARDRDSKPTGVHARLGPVEDRKPISKESVHTRLGPVLTEEKEEKEVTEEKTEEDVSKPAITKITWP